MVKLSLLIVVFLFSSEKNRVYDKPVSHNVTDLDGKYYGKWKLEREDDGIKIFTRWVEVDDKLKVRQIKGEMVCDKPAATITKYIKDDQIASQWMSKVLEHTKISTINQNQWISYTVFNLPWPFENQDLVAKNTVSNTDGSIVIRIMGIPDYLPKKDGITRIDNFEGMWRLSRDGNSNTLVEYTVITKSKALAPRWITDPIIHNNFWSTMNNLQKMLQ